MKKKPAPKRRLQPEDFDITSMPTQLDSERAVLGSILLDNDVFAQAQASLRPEDFALDSHRRIYSRMLDLAAANKGIDIVTMAEELDRRKEVSAVGGIVYMSSLTDGMPRRENIEHYCKAVRDAARARGMIHACNHAIASLVEKENVDQVIGEHESSLLQIVSRVGSQRENIDVLREIFVRTLEIKKGKRPQQHLTFGNAEIDELTTGPQPGDYHILAGRTGHGKSSAMAQGALNNAERGRRVHIQSLEMTQENLLQRMISMESGISYTKLRAPEFLSDADINRVADASKHLAELPITIDDTGGLEIGEVCARLKMRALKGAELMYVDYLQMIQSDKYADRYEIVTESSGRLRDLAKSTRVPVIALCQLKRAGSGNDNPRPGLFDLKESGNIENDAFGVFAVWRTTNSRGEWTYDDEHICMKQRNGPTGYAMVRYHGPTLTFKARINEPGLDVEKEIN